MTGQELAKEISRFVNRMANGKEEQEFVDALMREHRTLQQNTFGLLCQLIREWASVEENRYDLRNEFTVQTCKKIVETVEEVRYNPPFI